MTTLFLEINNDSYLPEHLTYISETKLFTVLTERFGDWEKVHFNCPEVSEHYSFFKNLYFNPARRNMKSVDKTF